MKLQRVTNPAIHVPLTGWVNLDDFVYAAGHDLGSGVAFDDAAFAAAVATGKNVDVPNGTIANPRIYRLQNSITPSPFQHIRFWGGINVDINADESDSTIQYPVVNATCYILFSGTTNWLFEQSGSYSIIESCSVYQDPTTSPTAGGHFHHGGNMRPSWAYAAPDNTWDSRTLEPDFWSSQAPYITAEPKLINCVSIDAYDGFLADGMCWQSTINHVQCMQAVHANTVVNLPMPMGDLRWLDLMCGWGYRTNYGLLIHALDTSKIQTLCIKGARQSLCLAGDTGVITALNVANVDIEGCGQKDGLNGDIITVGTNTYDVIHNKFSGGHIAGGGTEYTARVNVGAASGARSSYGNILTNIEFGGYAYRDYGGRNRYTNNISEASPAAGTIGIEVKSGSNDALIADNILVGFPIAYGLEASADYSIWDGNNFRQCTANGSMNAGSKATGSGQGNIGVSGRITDW